MKISDFWRNMEAEFGQRYSHVLADSMALTELDSLTASEAIDKGIKPKQVWEALCLAQDVPAERWLGIDIEPKES
ncbi:MULTISPECIES: DUF3046 domain-containing protein [Micrococcaceae]|uniref:DUF3046 domain-containing protein n=1 Tax=Micrococcaceae TaxID=1268 RepID=UPI0010365C02|nr:MULTISPECIES: DUF3046 domain-containing protein [Micrococcaceae]TAP25611.1 DUF3046 domain-containing protein [Arthrobacter sp. S41]UXN31549.1 DUF3046 domain-containing protein [Glutamicibacter sp. M10]